MQREEWKRFFRLYDDNTFGNIETHTNIFSIEKPVGSRTQIAVFKSTKEKASILYPIILGCFCRNGIFRFLSLLVNDAIPMFPLSFLHLVYF